MQSQQRQITGARTEENVAVVNELVLSQEDQPQTHSSTRPTALSAVVRIIFFTTIVVCRDAY